MIWRLTRGSENCCDKPPTIHFSQPASNVNDAFRCWEEDKAAPETDRHILGSQLPSSSSSTQRVEGVILPPPIKKNFFNDSNRLKVGGCYMGIVIRFPPATSTGLGSSCCFVGWRRRQRQPERCHQCWLAQPADLNLRAACMLREKR